MTDSSAVPFPRGPFGTLLVDPPWDQPMGFESKTGAYIRLPYETMEDGELLSLPVASIASKDALLLLWSTNSKLPVAFGLLRAWGFRYVSIITWDKVSEPGPGVWLKGLTEHLLLGVRGKVPPPMVTKRGTTWTTLVRSERGHSRKDGTAKGVSQHSKKPGFAYRVGEDLGPSPRIELFARTRRSGWEAWGNEVQETVQVPLQVETTQEVVPPEWEPKECLG